MFSGCKSCSVWLGLCICVSSGYAAVPKKPVLKAIVAKNPVIHVNVPVRPATISMSQLSIPVINTNTLLKKVEPEVQRQALQHNPAPVPNQVTSLTVDARLQPLVVYLQANHYKWPAYTDGAQARSVLRRIHNFMNVEEPEDDVIALQRQIILLYQHSRAPLPEQTLHDTRFFMAVQHRVPVRDYVGNDAKYSADEIALGEELAFALEAAKVPMENNPFTDVPGLDVIADQAHVYTVLRRVTPLFEGLPEYSSNQEANFPLWTQEEYVRQRASWIEEHPFEYILSPYRERYFGVYLPNIYNQLSKTEKTAIMFHTPGVWELGANFAFHDSWYQYAVNRWWYKHKGQQPGSHCNEEDVLVSVLKYGRKHPNAPTLFVNQFGESVSFLSLDYEDQVEVLMWAWSKYRFAPKQVLEILAF